MSSFALRLDVALRRDVGRAVPTHLAHVFSVAVIAERHRFVMVHHSHRDDVRGLRATIAPSVRRLEQMRRSFLAVLAFVIVTSSAVTLDEIRIPLRLAAMHARFGIQVFRAALAIVPAHVFVAHSAEAQLRRFDCVPLLAVLADWNRIARLAHPKRRGTWLSVAVFVLVALMAQALRPLPPCTRLTAVGAMLYSAAVVFRAWRVVRSLPPHAGGTLAPSA